VLHRENRLPVPGGVGAVNTVPVNGYVQQMIPAAGWAVASQAAHDQRAVFLTMSDAEIEWLLAVWSGALKVYR
ncbi:hypothetical protein, partial [Aeromonas veronii]